jgi:hypothetical protein
MLLVPRQLQRVGMTGDVPYYGGRLTPAQAYAASHRSRTHAAPPPTVTDPSATLDALAHLRDSGVITRDEYTQLAARVTT